MLALRRAAYEPTKDWSILSNPDTRHPRHIDNPYGRDTGGCFCIDANWSRNLTLTTHAIVGATIASVMAAHPILAIAAAFASHFLLDAIPHWDYPIRSDSVKPGIAATMKYDGALFTDLLTIGADAVLGIGLVLLFLASSGNLKLVLCGAGAAILPDALQFAYMRFAHEPLASLQRFHRWIHASKNLNDRPIWGCLLKSV